MSDGPESYDGVKPPVEYALHEDGTWRPLNLPPKVDRFGRPYLTCPICHNVTGCVTRESLGRHLSFHHPAVPAMEERPISWLRAFFRGSHPRRA